MVKLQTTPFKYVLPIMLLYSIVSLVGMYHHELFLEEAQQLTIARNSSSIFDVYKNMLYEGHVTLWNSLLFCIAHYISARPVYMQLFHLLVINGTVFVFLRYAPFTLPVKALVIFGGYFLFVYSVVCRNYALGILLLFICCILMNNPPKNMLRIGAVLVLMCFTHLFYVFAAIGIFAYLLFYTIGKKELYRRFAVLTSLFLFGVICAFIESRRMPADSILHASPGLSWLNGHNICYGIACIARGFITIPPVHQQHFWDKQLIQHLPTIANAILGLLLFIVTILFLYNSKKAMLFYVPSIMLLTVFFVMSGVSGNRYFGLYFIFFIVALWLAYYDGVTILPTRNVGFVKKWTLLICIYGLLINQLFTGVFMYCRDMKQPFSEAKNTVSYLRTNRLDKLPMLIDGYNAGPSLSAYLGGKVFYLDIDQFGSFCVWKDAYFPQQRRSLMDEITSSKYANSYKEFILVTNRNDKLNDSAAYSFNKLASFEGAIIEGEDYYVYKAVRK